MQRFNHNSISRWVRGLQPPNAAVIPCILAVAAWTGTAVAQDTDGDGLTDAQEIAMAGGTGCPDPYNPDSDGDQLLDGDEVLIYGCNPCAADTDGDSLDDFEEVHGIIYVGGGGGMLYPLPNANPARIDIFVEVDTLSGYVPSLASRQAVVAAFANAPVTNYDGTTGITLHPQGAQGELLMDDTNIPVTTWTYNPAGGVYWPPEFSSLKMNMYGSAGERSGNPDWWLAPGISGPLRDAKMKAYRYCIVAKQLGTTSIGGLAEFPGNDFMVTLGSQAWTQAFLQAAVTQPTWGQDVEASAFMHELGHNLGLGHGGAVLNSADAGPLHNFKPNYFSIMNYSWTYPRWVTGATSRWPTPAQVSYGNSWTLDYSTSAWATLDEQNLNENNSLCGGGCGGSPPTVVPVGPPGPWGYGWLSSPSTTIDYNRNSFIDPGILPAYPTCPVIPGQPPTDVNWILTGMPPSVPEDIPYLCPLAPNLCPYGWSGIDDWSNLWYANSGHPNFANGASVTDPNNLPAGLEPDFESVRMLSFLGGCAYEDPFDYYEANVQLDTLGGWKGWDNDPALTGFVTDAVCSSEPHAMDVVAGTDAVHEFCVEGPGVWSISTWQYIPADFTSGGGTYPGSYFILLNSYDDEEPHSTDDDWSCQMNFDSNDGMLKVYYGNGMNTNNEPYKPDEWIELQVIVDLNTDWTRVYYDGLLMAEYSWTAGVQGIGTGELALAAVDLYAQGSTSIFYDDLVLEQINSECAGDDLMFDFDGDTLTLLDEFLLGTDPCHPDTDLDGWVDGDDNCPLTPNPDQFDTDGDGIGDACDEPDPVECPEDLVLPEGVEQQDLNAVLNRWGDSACLPGGAFFPCPEDLVPPEGVEQQDLNAVLNRWGDPLCEPPLLLGGLDSPPDQARKKGAPKN